MSRRTLGVAFVLLSLAGTAAADRPRTGYVWQDPTPEDIANTQAKPLLGAPLVPYNKIFLNSCKPNGCVITPGSANSINNRWGISATRTLTKFPFDDTAWNNIVSCVKDVFGPFGVEITTVDPAPGNHFEIMIAGRPTDLGLSSGVGGISPFNCSTYINNSLVFDFAAVWADGSSGGVPTCGAACVEENCATAAQEIAHSFALDHVILASDPLTYYGFSGRKQFQDTQAQCGSDCVGGQGPGGETCFGANNQSHACACTGLQTQNSVATIKNLFGAGTPTPPMVKITRPKTGDSVQPGFPVLAEVNDENGVMKAELYINGALVPGSTITSAPYAFNAPTTLGDGTHRIEVKGYDSRGAVGSSAIVTVIIGKPCGKPADCPDDSQTCVGGRCVPGPGTQGGLGQPCTMGTDCASGNCASDGTNAYCVEDCELGKGQCPSNFGCLDNGAMMGICWPGYDDGTGGCTTGSGGPISVGLLFAALVFARRRR